MLNRHPRRWGRWLRLSKQVPPYFSSTPLGLRARLVAPLVDPLHKNPSCPAPWMYLTGGWNYSFVLCFSRTFIGSVLRGSEPSRDEPTPGRPAPSAHWRRNRCRPTLRILGQTRPLVDQARADSMEILLTLINSRQAPAMVDKHVRLWSNSKAIVR